MIMFAYTECGLSLEQFFELSWYEWSLEIERVRVRKKRDSDIWEGNAVLTGELMALIANVNRDPKKRANAYMRTDFFVLSFDDKKLIEDRRFTAVEPDKIEETFNQQFSNVK